LASVGSGLKVLMVDHQDSFVHSLGSYVRQCGSQLLTLRPEPARNYLRRESVDLVVLSPGPARPADFAMRETLALCLAQGIPVFGVCLGLQGIVEYFGGRLDLLDYPMHGKPSRISHRGGVLFKGIASSFNAGRYHSLYAAEVPDCLRITATDEAGIVMAVEHAHKPIFAVQFHPESIMSLEQAAGLQLVANTVEYVARLRQMSTDGKGRLNA
ncbi:MAG: gamma-glutamyl-gamma-aminobutyrate hydrolase family protein, partial [Pseudohongiellaceae bacterium]